MDSLIYDNQYVYGTTVYIVPYIFKNSSSEKFASKLEYILEEVVSSSNNTYANSSEEMCQDMALTNDRWLIVARPNV